MAVTPVSKNGYVCASVAGSVEKVIPFASTLRPPAITAPPETSKAPAVIRPPSAFTYPCMLMFPVRNMFPDPS